MSSRCPRLRDKLDYVEEEEYKANAYNEDRCDIKEYEEEKLEYKMGEDEKEKKPEYESVMRRRV